MIAARAHGTRAVALALAGLLIGSIAFTDLSEKRPRSRACGALALHDPQWSQIQGGVLKVHRLTLRRCARFDDNARDRARTLAAFAFGEHEDVIRAQIEIACQDPAGADVRFAVFSYDRDSFYRGLQ